MESLEVKYRLTKRELTSYIRFNFFRSFFSTGNLFAFLGILSLLAAYLLILGVKEISNYIDTFSGTLLLMLLVAIIKFLVIGSNVERLIKSKHYLTADKNVIITNEGIIRVFEIGEALEKWDEIYDYFETKFLYVIRLTKVEDLILPKSMLENNDQLTFVEKGIDKIRNSKLQYGEVDG